MTSTHQAASFFLDTEWADDDGRELVSLALVPGGPYGLFIGTNLPPFYAERDPLPTPSTYVRSVVYPLLERGAHAKGDTQFSQELGEYIAQAYDPRAQRSPIIIATHANDFTLLRQMLTLTHQAPSFEEELRYSESLIDRIRTAFASNAELSRRRHHALVDAQVLQSVYAGWFAIGRSI